MKKTMLLLFIGVMVAGCDWSGEEDPVFDYNKKSAEVIRTNNSFGLDLLNQVIANEDATNVMISPASVSLALGMAYNGAETSTKAAFDSVLKYDGLTRAEVNEVMMDLINTLVTDSKGNLLEIANSVWYRTGFDVFQGFIEQNKTYYGAEVKELDFSSPGAVDEINDWVADKTHDKINKIINELSPESMMVLINALYFNCLWETEFDKDETSLELFRNEDGTEYGKVEMMKTESTFKVASSEAFTAVELPYRDNKFSMRLFLPSGDMSVDGLISQLDGKTWDSWMEEFVEQNDVQVSLPKFKFDYKRSMANDLIEMGLGIAFTGQADFSGISDIDLLISDVIHKTYIDVNEEGTEAAAVTAVVFETTSVGPGPTIITFDRPFLFAITENSSNSIVFVGKVTEPKYEE